MAAPYARVWRLRPRKMVKADLDALDLSCLFRGPHEDDDLASLLHCQPVFGDWIPANWGMPDTVRIEAHHPIGAPQAIGARQPTEAHQTAMADDRPRPGTLS